MDAINHGRKSMIEKMLHRSFAQLQCRNIKRGMRFEKKFNRNGDQWSC